MELHPTPKSWRIALVTAVGAVAVGLAALWVADLVGAFGAWLAAGVVGAAALATFVPAVGTLSAVVDADNRGVTIRRFGRARRYGWGEVVDVRVIERRASVPDGTEYHWVVPGRSRHVVEVPVLELADGSVRELPALAAAVGAATAHTHARALGQLRGAVDASPAQRVPAAASDRDLSPRAI